VAHLGRSSVRYEIGLFADDAPLSAAVGSFVHVYVDRASRRPVPVPDTLRAALLPLMQP
jgi:acyl-CoA thioester hydrolase